MRIAVVGLGLIGGSLCRAFKSADKGITVLGADRDRQAVAKALKIGAIDSEMIEGQDIDADVVFVALHPRAAIEYITGNIKHFKKGCIVTDVCGVKQAVASACQKPLEGCGVHFVGGHPMAGKERWGFDSSDARLFSGASYILTRSEGSNEQALAKLKALVEMLGCKVVITDDKVHDEMIAYTSQLAHIVSNAYIKSPSAAREDGYTGGSFQDLTRVAYLDENLWTELFMYNRESLLKEFDIFMQNMQKYRTALVSSDDEGLKVLLKQGRDIKGKLGNK